MKENNGKEEGRNNLGKKYLVRNRESEGVQTKLHEHAGYIYTGCLSKNLTTRTMKHITHEHIKLLRVKYQASDKG